MKVFNNCAGAQHDQGAVATNSLSLATRLQAHTSGPYQYERDRGIP